MSPESAAAASEQATLARLAGNTLPSGRIERYGREPAQCIEFFGSDEGPLVEFVHGGYFRPEIDRAHARPLATSLARCGLQVALIEYRRTPGDPLGTYADVAAAEEHLRGRGGAGPTLRIGHSAGGTLVLDRALAEVGRAGRPTLALAPVADLVRAASLGLGDGATAAWIGASPDAAHDLYEVLDPQFRGRELGESGDALDGVLLVHGDLDQTVPHQLSDDFPAPTEIIAGAQHFDLIDPDSPFWPPLRDLMRELAGPR